MNKYKLFAGIKSLNGMDYIKTMICPNFDTALLYAKNEAIDIYESWDKTYPYWRALIDAGFNIKEESFKDFDEYRIAIENEANDLYENKMENDLIYSVKIEE